MKIYRKYGVAQIIRLFDTDTYDEEEISCKQWEKGIQKRCKVCGEYRDLDTEFDYTEDWDNEKSDVCNWCKEV